MSTTQRTDHSRHAIVRLASSVALAATALAALALGAVNASGAQSPAQAAFVSSTLGYEVTLPASFRRSARYSYVAAATDAFYVGQDVLTTHTDAEEAADTSRTMGPTHQWTVYVEVLRNPANLAPLDFFNRMEWAKTQTVQSVTFAGSPAVRVQSGARFPLTYYVSHGGLMFLISYSSDAAHPKAGVTAADLQGIVNSFRFTR